MGGALPERAGRGTGLLGAGAPEDTAAAYADYRSWLAFVVPLHDFERAMRADLGYAERFRPGRSSSIVAVIARGPKDRPQPLEHLRGTRP